MQVICYSDMYVRSSFPPPRSVFKNLWEMNEELLSAGGYARLPSTRSPEAWEFSTDHARCYAF